MNSGTYENLIVRIAAQGDGITQDGRHVALSAPGDIIDENGGLIHGSHHIDPICPHFNLCGGCQLQHVSDDALEQFVAERIEYALQGQGIEKPIFHDIYLSPPKSRRRVSLRSSWVGKNFQLGFSSEKSHRILDIKQCDVMTAKLFALVQPLRHFLKPMIDRRRNVQIKMAQIDQGIDILIENWSPEGLDQIESLSEFARTHQLARLSVDDGLDDGLGPVTQWEPEPATITLHDVAVPYPHFAFLQATQDGEDMLVEAVRDIMQDAVKIADLFAGLGTFSLSAQKHQKIYAAEGMRAAILALKSASARAQRQVFTEHRDLYRRPLSVEELNRFDAVILDPPRAGAREQVDQLAASSVKIIAYVSCNPSSFARDAKRLIAGGYRLEKIWPVGQFRWSTHVELVSKFVKI